MTKIPERLPHSIKGLNDMLDFLGDVKDKTMLEIGSWTGLSSVEFSKRFKHVCCVDPWQATEGINTEYDMSEVEKIFDKRKKKNVAKIKHTSSEASEILGDNKFDYIYIDGCHTYEAVKLDIENWKDKCKIAICGHDYWPGRFDGVIKAVDEAFGKPDKVFSDTSWVKYL